jgi:hypothetical protein
MFTRGRFADFMDTDIWSSKDIVNASLSILTFLATLFIPVAIAFYTYRQEQLLAERERRERLQRFEERLAGIAEAFFSLQNFKDSCKRAGRDDYAIVYRDRHTSHRLRETGEAIDYVKLDAARALLANTWDGVADDQKDGLLPRTGLKKRILRRGKNYMFLVEPLDCANWYRNKQEGDYILNGTFNDKRPGRYQWIEQQYGTLGEAGWANELKEHHDNLEKIIPLAGVSEGDAKISQSGLMG